MIAPTTATFALVFLRAIQQQNVIGRHYLAATLTSFAMAAHYYGVEFIGVELDEDYYKAAVERFIAATKQRAMDI